MAQTVDLTSYRTEFPLVNEWAYMNHAAHGPYPSRTVAAVKAYADGWANPAAFDHERNMTIQRETREGLAELAGGRPDMVAFVGSLADGMNLFANGLDYRDGDNVIMPAHEFPSVVYPFLNLQRKGVSVRFAERNAEGRTDIGIIEAEMDDCTRAVVISHIEWQDGWKNDLKALGALCQSRGVELFVDATQSLGAQPINLSETGVTAIAAHGYKWLLSAFGTGVVVFNEGAIDRIYPAYAGRLSVKGEVESQSWTLDLKDTAERYQTGGLNMLSMTAMHASLSMLREVTPAASSAYTAQLVQYLADGLAEQGYEVVSDLSPEHRSQIMTFTSGDAERNQQLIDDLEGRKIPLSLRGGEVRVSPYFYNSTADIDRLLEALPPR